MFPDRNKPPARPVGRPAAPPPLIPRLHLPSQLTPGSGKPTKPAKQNRSRRKRVIILSLSGLVIGLVILLGLTFNYMISQPVNRLDGSAYLVTVQKGESVVTIARQLSDKKLIRSQKAFVLYAKLGPAHGQLIAGTYSFKPNQSIARMISLMHAGAIATVSVPIVEGLNETKLAQTVARSSFTTADNFTAALSQTYANKVLAVRPAGTTSLEGLLAPGIYDMVINQSAHDLVSDMLDHFDQTTANYRAMTAPQSMTFYQALTLSSLVELEAGNTTDRKLIAGVFLNRLRLGMKLQTDTSLIYITGRSTVTAADTSINSPYNTYQIVGLPPTPIDSPSVAAIDAVYHYTPSNYLFFVGGNDGKVHYAETYAQHQANIAQYLQ